MTQATLIGLHADDCVKAMIYEGVGRDAVAALYVDAALYSHEPATLVANVLERFAVAWAETPGVAQLHLEDLAQHGKILPLPEGVSAAAISREHVAGDWMDVQTGAIFFIRKGERTGRGEVAMPGSPMDRLLQDAGQHLGIAPAAEVTRPSVREQLDRLGIDPNPRGRNPLF